MKVLHQSDDISSHIQQYCWNGIYSHECSNNIDNCKPSAIYLPENEQDLISIFQTQSLPFAIKSGGHSIAGDCLPKLPNSILIDLQCMNQIHLIENTSRLFSFQVQSGCLLKQVDEFCSNYQMILPSGMVSHTGVAGLTLGGGLGWFTRWLGLTSDHVTSYRVLYFSNNNSYEYITVDANGHFKDLFYQLQGNGITKQLQKKFIVTSFTFTIAKELISNWQNKIIQIQWQFQPSTKEEYEHVVEEYFTTCSTITSNQVSCFGFAEKPFFTIIAVYPLLTNTQIQNELDTQVDSIIQRFLNCKPIYMNIEENMTYCELQRYFDCGVPHGKNYYWKSLFVNSEQWNAKQLAKVLNEYLEQVNELKTKNQMRCSVEVMHLGGALKANLQKSSFQCRDCPFEMHTILLWEKYQSQALQIAKEAGKLFETTLCKDKLTLPKGYINFQVEKE